MGFFFWGGGGIYMCVIHRWAFSHCSKVTDIWDLFKGPCHLKMFQGHWLNIVYDFFFYQAVFKNYDHDKDGFISHDEFKAIAGNFPFIDSFCVLDADQYVYSSFSNFIQVLLLSNSLLHKPFCFPEKYLLFIICLCSPSKLNHILVHQNQ